MVKNVVILGAGWAGLPLAHKLLKYTAPKTNIKVTLVSPNSHFFWNVAATRGIIRGEIPDDQLFLPIKPAFAKYSTDDFEFILGAAVGITAKDNVVTVMTNDAVSRSIEYDQLVIATGSRLASNLPMKCIGTHEATMASWKVLQAEVAEAQSVVIAGAGATGIEVAGEIAAKYGKDKTVSLIVSGDELLETQRGVLASVRATLEKDLQKLGVEIIRNARVTNADNGPRKSNSLNLSNGSTLVADCYLPLYGIRVNTSFVPDDLVDAEGNVRLAPDMRVMGTKNIWGIGDVGNLEPKQLTVTDSQIIHLASTLDAVLAGDSPQKPYQLVGKTMLFLSLGKNLSTGQIGNWRLFGFMTSYVKGRKLFVDTAEGYVGGKHLRHAAM